MNWKEFLKPDWEKIVITVIITAAWILFLRFIISNTVVLCEMCPDTCPEGNYVNYLIVPKLCPCCVSLSEVYENYLWNLIIPFIFSYFISCLIIWIYNRMKKK
jgi:hypothetical protein